MKFRPMPGKIVVQPLPDNETVGSLGLIIAPGTTQRPRTTAKVIAIYEPFLLDNADVDSQTEAFVNVGDIVLFGTYVGTDVVVDRQKFIVLKEADILCILEADDATLNLVAADAE